MNNSPNKTVEESLKNDYQYQIQNLEAISNNLIEDKDGILTDEEKQIGTDIILEYKKNLADFSHFLQIQYMDFDHKINKCLYNYCHKDIFKQRDEVLQCRQSCKAGIKHADQFVDQIVNNFTNQFYECIENAQENRKDIMKESFQCYDTLIRGFHPIKKLIKQEFNYYQ